MVTPIKMTAILQSRNYGWGWPDKNVEETFPKFDVTQFFFDLYFIFIFIFDEFI